MDIEARDDGYIEARADGYIEAWAKADVLRLRLRLGLMVRDWS